MRIVLESGWRRVELVDSSESVAAPQLSERLGRNLLRRYVTDPLAVLAMRHFLAGQSESPWLHTDHAVVDEVERQIQIGELRLVETSVRPTPIQSKPATGGAPPPPPVKTPAPAATAPAPPPPVSPNVTSLEKQQCSNPSCQAAFSNAAENGTPLVEADAPGC